MIITTAPWHIIGLQGQPRRISSTPYDTPLVQTWQAGETIMIVGAVILLISALLLIVVLLKTHGNAQREDDRELGFAEPIHPVLSLPASLNNFAIWNWIILIYIVVSYGYPIAQFFMMPTYGAFPWSI